MLPLSSFDLKAFTDKDEVSLKRMVVPNEVWKICINTTICERLFAINTTHERLHDQAVIVAALQFQCQQMTGTCGFDNSVLACGRLVVFVTGRRSSRIEGQGESTKPIDYASPRRSTDVQSRGIEPGSLIREDFSQMCEMTDR